MISESKDTSDKASPEGFPGKTRQITVLLAIDIALVLGALFCRDFRNDSGKILQSLAILLHTPIGIFIGIQMLKSYRKQFIVAAYWISVLLPPASFVAPQVVGPLRIFFPFGLLPSAVFVQWLIVLALLSRHFGRGRWPLPLAIFFTVCGLLLVGVNFSFETTEFGPLGMLFANMFATPFFLILPAAIRIPAHENIRFYVIKLQQVTYGLTVFAWIIFILRVCVQQ